MCHLLYELHWNWANMYLCMWISSSHHLQEAVIRLAAFTWQTKTHQTCLRVFSNRKWMLIMVTVCTVLAYQDLLKVGTFSHIHDIDLHVFNHIIPIFFFSNLHGISWKRSLLYPAYCYKTWLCIQVTHMLSCSWLCIFCSKLCIISAQGMTLQSVS